MTVPARSRLRRTWLLHLAGVVAVPSCLAAGLFELGRARGGNELSWGYAVEWPLIAGYVVYMWRRLLRERRDPQAFRRKESRAAIGEPAEPDDDLVAWQQYLARLHAADPPGGPPGR